MRVDREVRHRKYRLHTWVRLTNDKNVHKQSLVDMDTCVHTNQVDFDSLRIRDGKISDFCLKKAKQQSALVCSRWRNNTKLTLWFFNGWVPFEPHRGCRQRSLQNGWIQRRTRRKSREANAFWGLSKLVGLRYRLSRHAQFAWPQLVPVLPCTWTTWWTK